MRSIAASFRLAAVVASFIVIGCHGFATATSRTSSTKYLSLHLAAKDDTVNEAKLEKITSWSRRDMLSSTFASLTVALMSIATPPPTHAADFGVKVGNAEASPSRQEDNANVLFTQDYYYIFGTAAQWIEPDSTDFPKSMPYTKVQQRYDAIKKYQSRVVNGLARIKALDEGDIADPTVQDVYSLRPMGLLANSMLSSENKGKSDELYLTRWYVNEMYLHINDARTASTKDKAMESVATAKKAGNSYLTLMNRVITSKVGDKFEYL
mmetsp:Transcript_20818/g.26892  ORF Transcript_20818/g.26892 Transcript_20818/m.26892 type:complete len:266 (-) Transcript_20818:340-1137(-)|eukprot:CAMPEP_0198139724 /NCGR_PEP_ID=MMETSP1443-20131203/2975_1 /TAXON_ID=186043 /ORGANISM="Entomoneis sp., Strain CCMP2396" /LENGTH=265 /DNA_ID=CAMNT_0043801927 /DNA_START=100 /DNA_END=897 /DNA_ORIENTATION=-